MRLLRKSWSVWQEIGIDNAVAVQGPLAGDRQAAPFNVIFINGCVADVPLIYWGS